MALNWAENRDELSRQLQWQQVLADFYQNGCYGGYERRDRLSADRASERRESLDFYNRIVLPHDSAIKKAFREGDSVAHRRLLDEAYEIIRGMHQHTNLALSHEKTA